MSQGTQIRLPAASDRGLSEFLGTLREATRRAGNWRAALLVAAGYFLGAKIGFAFTFHPHPISTLWLPNSLLLSALLLLILRRPCRLALLAFPIGEAFLGLGDDKERHMRMLSAAELGALPTKRPRSVGREIEHVHLPGDEVLFTVQVRNPKAVDHIIGAQNDPHRLADGNVDFVRAHKGTARLGREVPNLPPPLVANNLYADGTVSAFGEKSPPGRIADDGQRDQGNHCRGDGSPDKDADAAFGSRRRLWFGDCREIMTTAAAPHRPDQRQNN